MVDCQGINNGYLQMFCVSNQKSPLLGESRHACGYMKSLDIVLLLTVSEDTALMVAYKNLKNIKSYIFLHPNFVNKFVNKISLYPDFVNKG